MKRYLPLVGLLALGCSDTVSDTALGFEAPPDAGAPDAAPDALPVEPVGLVINEVAAAGDPDDWFELYNGTATTIDLSRDWFSDDADEPLAVQFSSDAFIEPGAYYVQYMTDDVGIGLGKEEEVIVTHPDGLVVDHVEWLEGQSPEAASFARIPNITGAFVTIEAPSPGAANEGV